MLPIADDGRLQMTAGLALLETSKLVLWNWDAARFTPVTFDDFERALKNFDATFGRVICWILFSAGAEFLAKGVCLLNGINIRKPDCVPSYPPAGEVANWLESYRRGSQGTMPTTNFGPIANLYNRHLQSLCNNVDAPIPATNRLLKAYELMGRTIRNRDAHAYVPKIRGSHFDLVSDLFIPCLNDLVSWTNLPPLELNTWRKEAQQFIDSTIDHYSDQSLCNKVAASKNRRKQKTRQISQRFETYSESELDGVIVILDRWEASMNAEQLDLAEQGMTDYADGLADEDIK